MSDMREAFQKALKEKSNPVLKDVLERADRLQHKERELENLKRRFRYIGESWVRLKEYHAFPTGKGLSSEDKVKEAWQRTYPLLVKISKEKRPQVVNQLAEGLNISEENLNRNNRIRFVSSILGNPLGELSNALSTNRFSPASIVFFEDIGRISGYSREQNVLFKDFMYQRNDLHGSVLFPQTFPAVADWLIAQSRNDRQSSRLS